ncbi:holin [Sediminibacillus massiliensis]|uniref:holin n=1 Tax=Sediminibacillus massiliensis TaxID=1926277 RepID=UPI000988336F|nr:holin [Sediminibacillus massiliensis]
MEEVLAFATLLLPIVLALVELIKRTVNMPKAIVPAVSFAVGILVGAIAYPFSDMELVLRLWAGGFAGLSGTGLFELVKSRPGTTK